MDRTKTLEQLENSKWADYDFESNLIRRCHALRKFPMEKLETEDLRLLIGQKIGLNFLVTLAIEKQSTDILAEGDYYPGDLLKSVLSIEKRYWVENKSQWQTIAHLIQNNLDKIQQVKLNLDEFYKK